jgi:hypothetical protein
MATPARDVRVPKRGVTSVTEGTPAQGEIPAAENPATHETPTVYDTPEAVEGPARSGGSAA